MGTTMVLPMYLLYRSSFGLTSMATHAGINSGRRGGNQGVVACAFEWEADVVQYAVLFDVVYFCVGNCSFIMRAPIHWVHASVHEAFLVEQYEAELRAAPVIWVHCAVLGCPIDAAAQLKDAFFHHGDVFFDEFHAHLAELRRAASPVCGCCVFFQLGFLCLTRGSPSLAGRAR